MSSKQKIEQEIDEAVGSVKEEQSWLLTYADMMTLLFAFFVLLFSLSTIDPVKVSQLQDGMGDKPELKSFNEITKEFETIIEELNIKDQAKVSRDPRGVTLEIDGESYTMTVSMAGEVMESLSGNFSETNGSPCLDGECISANWVTTGSVWDMDTESDAYCEDADGNDTSDADQTACESADNDWYSESCTQTVWTKQ